MDKHYIVKKSTVHWGMCLVVIMIAIAALVNYGWVYLQMVALKMTLGFFILLFVLMLMYMVVRHGTQSKR